MEQYSFKTTESTTRLQNTIDSLAIKAKVVGEIVIGHDRLLAVSLSPGVRVKDIVSMKDEIALAIQTSQFSFDIPIEGTSFLGVRIKGSVFQDADNAYNFDKWDDYLVAAGRLVINKGRAAIGMLQREYKIGFNRAARIMDQLCELGAVGEENGVAPRKVIMTLSEFEMKIKEMTTRNDLNYSK